MIRRKKIIQCPAGAVMKLAEAHNVTKAAVYNALAYRSDSETAIAIRRQALDLYGGVEANKIVFENH